jgi:hypothetical protein
MFAKRNNSLDARKIGLILSACSSFANLSFLSLSAFQKYMTTFLQRISNFTLSSRDTPKSKYYSLWFKEDLK